MSAHSAVALLRGASVLEHLESRALFAAETGLRADYYNSTLALTDTTLAVTKAPELTRTDGSINFAWGSGAPATGINTDNFMVRWSGQVKAVESGAYTFHATGDDGFRVWLNGNLILNRWSYGTGTVNSAAITLSANSMNDIRVDYREGGGGASMKLEWTRPNATKQVIPQAQFYPFSKPLSLGTSSAGGLFVGSWESTSPTVNAVLIATTSPVTISHSTVRSARAGIRASVTNGHVTVLNTKGYGLNPNVAGQSKGRFVEASHVSYLRVENNYLESTAGISMLRDNAVTGGTFLIRYNEAKNIDGRESDGLGGYYTWNKRRPVNSPAGTEWEFGFNRVQFVQFNNVQNTANAEIAWNKVINLPYQSCVEDNINMYISGGTASTPLRIHNNYIDGAYHVAPNKPDLIGITTDGVYDYNWSYGGGGIMLADGGDFDASGNPTKPYPVSRYVWAYDNVIVRSTGHSIAIAAGNNNKIFNNIALSSGLLADNATHASHSWATSYVNNAVGHPASYFHDNWFYDNTIGISRKNTSTGPWIRSDWWTPGITDPSYRYGNVRFNEGQQITVANEDAQLPLFNTRASNAGIVIGLT